MLADRVAVGDRRDHRLSEVLGVRAREADPTDPVHVGTSAQQLAELGASARSEVSPHELTFWPSSVISLTPRCASSATSAMTSLGPTALLPTSNCRDDAVRALRVAAHGHLHPGLERPLGTPRQIGCKVLVGAELPAWNGEATRGDPLAEVRDGARAEGDVHERVPLEDLLPLRLRVTPAHRDHEIGLSRLRAAALPRCAARRVSGFWRTVQVLKTTTSAASSEAASPRPSDSSMPLIRSESCAFIWHPNVVT